MGLRVRERRFASLPARPRSHLRSDVLNGGRRGNRDSEQLWIWSALLAAPTLMFANLSLTYGFTPLLCRVGGTAALHLLCASCALPTLVMTAGSVRTWQNREEQAGSEGESAGETTGLAEAASIAAALATLVLLAQWLAIWILPPCY